MEHTFPEIATSSTASTNTFTATGLKTDLEAIYKQANVGFTVEIKPNFVFDLSSNGTVGLERAGDGLNKYSSEMRALRDAYASGNASYDKKASYIFVVAAFEPDPTGGNISGFMPRGRSMGFVASGADMRTYAHELGHGAFGLEHTFPEILKSSTQNLMDYGSGTNLTQKQWNTIEKDKFVWSWLDEEEDGASSVVSLAIDRKVISKILNEIRTNIDNGVMEYYPFATIDHNYYPTSQGDKLFKVYGGLNMDKTTELAGYIFIERLNTQNNGQIILNNYTSKVGTIYHTITWAGEMEISVSSLATYNTILAYLTALPKIGIRAGKIIFVNGHYNEVASALGMSPSVGFEGYWGSLYEFEAKKYFNEISNFNLYVDGASALGGSENGIQRKERGKEWAKNNSNLLYSNMSTTGTFKILAHSEGGAFAAGIIEYLFSQGKTIQKVVYLSADEADEFSHNQAIDAVQIAYASCKKSVFSPMHYPYDGVVGNHKIYGVEKYGVVHRNDIDRDYIHGRTAFRTEIFKELQDLDMYQGRETLQYNWNSGRGEKEYIRPTFPNGTLFYSLDKFTFHLHTCP